MKNNIAINGTTLKSIIDRLPHAFDSLYWGMGETTYKEEVFLSIIESLKIPQKQALQLQSKVFPKNRLLRQILKEEIVECMGSYAKGAIGISFYGTYENISLGNGKGTQKVFLNKSARKC